MTAVLLSLVAPLGLLLLVLMPAWIELRRPTDVEPLNVPHDHNNHATRFATSYRARLQAMFGAPLAQTLQGIEWAGAARVDSVQVWLAAALAAPSAELPVACAGDLQLPERWRSSHEVFAAGDLRFGEGASARALLADGAVWLGAGSRVARWVHGRDVHFGAGSAVDARVTADRRIELCEGATFLRAHAPTIAWPRGAESVVAVVDPTDMHDFAGAPGAQLSELNERWVVFRDLDLPPSTRVRGDLIVHGDLQMRENCRIEGSLKVHGRLTMEPGCVITGACIGVRRIEIAQGCRIAGPLVGEGDLRIGPDSVVGELARPTSVNARSIALRRGACVHGTVWAKQLAYGIG